MSETRPKYSMLFLFSLLAIAAGAGGVFLADKLYYQPMLEQKRLVANLETIIQELTRTVRVAEVYVLEQTQNPVKTTFKFVEVNDQREPIGDAKMFTVDGDVVYFDALVMKFEQPFDAFDKLPLKETDKKELAARMVKKSIISFRRVFGEKQKPADGFPLDTPGQVPAAYRSNLSSEKYEQELWNGFWELANNPKLARERGVYTAEGEAVYKPLHKDKYYVIEQSISGGLNIVTQDLPAAIGK